MAVTEEKDIELQCPNCGGNIVFDVEAQQFRCASCGSVQQLEPDKAEVEEYDFSAYREREGQHMLDGGEETLTCASCGASVFLLPQDAATVCPMCGAPQLRVCEESNGIPVEGVVPFRLDRFEAQKIFGNWIRKRWFAPGSLKKLYAEGDLQGLYVPFWTYDAVAVAQYFGRGGRTRTRRTHDGKTETYTQWFPVSGTIHGSYDDIQVCASKAVSGNLIQKVLPYDSIRNTKPYQPQYLSGYKAERYTVDGIEGFGIARQIMERDLESRAERDIMSHGYSVANVTSLQPHYDSVRYKHILVPLWKAKYGYRGKTYHYMINGETGKVSAQYPISVPKVIAVVLAALLVIGGILFASGFFENSSGSSYGGGYSSYDSGYSYDPGYSYDSGSSYDPGWSWDSGSDSSSGYDSGSLDSDWDWGWDSGSDYDSGYDSGWDSGGWDYDYSADSGSYDYGYDYGGDYY